MPQLNHRKKESMNSPTQVVATFRMSGNPETSQADSQSMSQKADLFPELRLRPRHWAEKLRARLLSTIESKR
jgi:hypothetical protein